MPARKAQIRCAIATRVVCERLCQRRRPASGARWSSFDGSFGGRHLTVRTPTAERGEDSLLLPMGHVGIEIHGLAFALRRHVEVEQRNVQLRKNAVSVLQQMFTLAGFRVKMHVARLEAEPGFDASQPDKSE